MKNFWRLSLWVFTLLFLTSVSGMAFADDDDPPSRVARLKYVSGEVSIQPGGVDEWVAATVNRPLTTADRVWADKNSRAELHLGTAVMRLNNETSLTLTNLSDNTIQVELHQGTLNLRVNRLYRGEIYEVDTPNMAFTVQKAGNYRFDVDSNNDVTLVTVWKGKGIATGDGGSVKINAEKQVRFTGRDVSAYRSYDAPRRDGFDEWTRARDQRESGIYSARYVSPYAVGYEDLDGYGYWETVGAYGPVWYPRYVVAGWAPYRFGHWVWISPWGWTWVDDAPWGFAPFHYGRWVYYGSRWGWCPGPYSYRPYYAPALVAWVGGAHFGVSIGFGGGVGWFPLGFGEPYWPYYRASRRYYQNVNITNTRITNITTINNFYNVHNDVHNNIHNNVHNNVNIRYANQNIPGAVTAVDRDVMVKSHPVGRAAISVPDRDMRQATLLDGPDVRPSKVSVLGRADRSAAAPRETSRPVITRMAPPQRPARFEEAREARGDNGGGPQDRGRSADGARGRPGQSDAASGGPTPRDNGNGRGISRGPDQSPAGGRGNGARGGDDKSRFPASVPMPRGRRESAGQPNLAGPTDSASGQDRRGAGVSDRANGGPADRSRPANDQRPEFSPSVPRPQGRRATPGQQDSASVTDRTQDRRGAGADNRPTGPQVADEFPESVPRPRGRRETSDQQDSSGGTGGMSSGTTESGPRQMNRGRADRPDTGNGQGPSVESPRSVPRPDMGRGSQSSAPEQPRIERSAPRQQEAPRPPQSFGNQAPRGNEAPRTEGPRSSAPQMSAPAPQVDRGPSREAPRQMQPPSSAPRSSDGGGRSVRQEAPQRSSGGGSGNAHQGGGGGHSAPPRKSGPDKDR